MQNTFFSYDVFFKHLSGKVIRPSRLPKLKWFLQLPWVKARQLKIIFTTLKILRKKCTLYHLYQQHHYNNGNNNLNNNNRSSHSSRLNNNNCEQSLHGTPVRTASNHRHTGKSFWEAKVNTVLFSKQSDKSLRL